MLFGLNYTGTENALQGCINDVRNMAKWLETQGCSASNIFCYDDITAPAKCTRKGMLHELTAFAKKSTEEHYDWVWIHYSGHGTQIYDFSGDESDRKDEAIVPSDGYISDDELLEIIDSFHSDTRVIVLIDACHSGSMCDLPYMWDIDKEIKEVCPVRVSGPAVLLSGCMDTQTSADAYNRQDLRYGGAFTDAFLSVVKIRPTALENVFSLAMDIRNVLSHKQFTQIPQLSSTIDFTVNPALFPPIHNPDSPSPSAPPSPVPPIAIYDPALLPTSNPMPPCCSII